VCATWGNPRLPAIYRYYKALYPYTFDQKICQFYILCHSNTSNIMAQTAQHQAGASASEQQKRQQLSSKDRVQSVTTHLLTGIWIVYKRIFSGTLSSLVEDDTRKALFQLFCDLKANTEKDEKFLARHVTALKPDSVLGWIGCVSLVSMLGWFVCMALSIGFFFLIAACWVGLLLLILTVSFLVTVMTAFGLVCLMTAAFFSVVFSVALSLYLVSKFVNSVYRKIRSFESLKNE